MIKWYLAGLFSLLVLLEGTWAYADPRPIAPTHLNESTRLLLQVSMDLEEKCWDENAKLLRNPDSHPSSTYSEVYLVRESSWYALALLLRDRAGDRLRAAELLDAVLKQQYETPEERWYGTFRRSPEEPHPGAPTGLFRGYDPNWREFVGTTFAVILIEYPDRISPQLSARMFAAIDRAVDGEIRDGRLLPSYSNIALMHGFLWSFAAEHDRRSDWKTGAAQWTESVYRMFQQNKAFDEYNSPTYYGVDLYGLALWRSYGSTARLRAMGSGMEKQLWKDIADFYQPQLHNLSGPYDRAYGMDMESYVSLVGMWMGTKLQPNQAPLPALDLNSDHVADIWFAPHIAILGTRIPPAALREIAKFEGEHLLRKKIAEGRVATAWIGRNAIFGGETTGKTKDAGTTTQFHPATIQWRTPSGKIGWVQLVESPVVDAVADQQGLSIRADGTVRLRIQAKGSNPKKIGASQWELPGLNITVASDAKSFRMEHVGDMIDLVYTGMTGMRLGIRTTQDRTVNE